MHSRYTCRAMPRYILAVLCLVSFAWAAPAALILPSQERILSETQGHGLGVATQIEATPITEGRLKGIPYNSYLVGPECEMNIYGDPAAPACIEIGLRGSLTNDSAARLRCLKFLDYLMPTSSIGMLKPTGGKMLMQGSMAEVTPPDAPDAEGAWWVNIYNPKAVESIRVHGMPTAKPETPPAPPVEEAQPATPPTIETPKGSSKAISSTQPPHETPPPDKEWVDGYTRSDGTTVDGYYRTKRSSHSRSSSSDLIDVLGPVFIIGMIAFAVIGFVVLIKSQSGKVPQSEINQKMQQAKAFIEGVKNAKRLKAIDTSLFLQEGETAYYAYDASLFEPVSIRRGGATGASVGLGGGVRIGSAEYTSRSSIEWRQIAQGTVVVTNRRIIFDGSTKDRVEDLSGLLSVVCNPRMTEFSFNRKCKPMGIGVPNPLILSIIVQICRQAEDPGNLSEAELSIQHV